MSWQDDVRRERANNQQAQNQSKARAQKGAKKLAEFWDCLLEANWCLDKDLRLYVHKLPMGHYDRGDSAPHIINPDKTYPYIGETSTLFITENYIGATGKNERYLDDMTYFNIYYDDANDHLYGFLRVENGLEYYIINHDSIDILLRNICAGDCIHKGLQKDWLKNLKGNCFIATAVYGSYDSPEVVLLRVFRDNTLAKSTLGRAFIRVYYTYSPPIAEFVAGKESLRKILRLIFDSIIRIMSKRTGGRC